MRSSTVAPSIGPKSATDRNADADFGLVDHVGFSNGDDDPVGQLLHLLARLSVDDDDGELIAAHATDVTVDSDLVDQALGDRAEHGVALGVTEGVVDRLEAIEVEKEDRARRARRRSGTKTIAEQLADSTTVRQTRKHVHVRKMREPLLRLAHFGDVAADAAKALEAAGRIDDRIARNRNPARAASGLQLHVELVERLLLKQLTAQFGIAAQQRRHRVTEQLARRTAEQSRHSRTDISDAILAIDLPQPAHAALLIFLEQQACTFALGAKVGIGLELFERPAGDVEDAENRDAQREQDRDHMLERNRVAADEHAETDAGGEGRHPADGGTRVDDKAKSGDSKTGGDRRGDHLRSWRDRREQIER